jgi:hypothetical protein
MMSEATEGGSQAPQSVTQRLKAIIKKKSEPENVREQHSLFSSVVCQKKGDDKDRP